MIKNIFLIGVGGTGGLLAAKLSKFLNKGDKLFLIDGDKVEFKNTLRQPYQIHDVDKFKAEALTSKINSVSSFKNCFYVNKFIDKEDSLYKIVKKVCSKISYINEKIIIISCVDNHRTRILIEKSLSLIITNYKKNSYISYIDSANEEDYGDILINVRRSKYYKLKIEKEDELKLTEENCEELITDGVIQQFATNDQAANLILKTIDKDFSINLEQYAIIKFNDFNSKIIEIPKSKKWLDL